MEENAVVVKAICRGGPLDAQEVFTKLPSFLFFARKRLQSDVVLGRANAPFINACGIYRSKRTPMVRSKKELTQTYVEQILKHQRDPNAPTMQPHEEIEYEWEGWLWE